jgi:peptide deformylase
MSAKDSIIALPNDRLRQKSQRVPILTPEITDVIKQMVSSTVDWEDSREHEVGVALAAIQIDRPYKVIIIRNDFENKANKDFSIFINPEIVKLEGEIKEDYEGCLSVTDIYGRVPRHTKVRIRALDENGNPVRIKAEGFLARVFQHEIDHTNGIMFVDHLKDNQKAFYKLTSDGKLKELPYEKVEKAHIFED